MNRRHWLSLVLTSSASTVLLSRSLGAISPSRHEVGPGLFFDQSDLSRIREQYLNHPDFAELRGSHANYDYRGQANWLETEVRFNDALMSIRPLRMMAEDTAFIAAMTDNVEAEALAKKAIRTLMKFPRWDFFLDGDQPIAVQRASHSVVSLCLVIDLLGDRLDDAERKEWLQTMWERGVTPCFRTVEDIRHPTTVDGWRFDPDSTFFEHRPGNRTDMNRRPEITYVTNLRAVPASALVVGTVAYELEFGASAEVDRFREMGIWGMEIFRELFKADGSYDEEVSYANYTATHLVQAIIAMRRHTEVDMTDLIDWDAFVDYLYNMSMPTHDDPYALVNWGDSGQTPARIANVKRAQLSRWIAGETDNGFAQAFARDFGGAQDVWAALWFEADVKPKLPPNENKLWVSDLDRVVARTGYRPEDLVVALRSGPPANHEHGDRNSIIVKCFGQELITDPLRPAYSFSDPAWRMRLTEGHSAILIDGHGHEHHNGIEGTNASASFARIVSHHSNDRYAQWVSDATQPYRLVDTDIKLVRRSMAVLFDHPAIVMVDRITKWRGESTVQARFFGYNWDDKLRMTAEDYGFQIHRPGSVLRAQVIANVDWSSSADTMDILGDNASIHPFVDVTTAPTTDLTLVTVMGLAESEAGLPAMSAKSEGAGFTLEIGDQRVSVLGEAITIS